MFLRGRREKREKRGGYKAEGKKTEKRERGIVLKAKYLLKNKRNFCSDKINFRKLDLKKRWIVEIRISRDLF